MALVRFGIQPIASNRFSWFTIWATAMPMERRFLSGEDRGAALSASCWSQTKLYPGAAGQVIFHDEL
jgi:hypothetical protein